MKNWRITDGEFLWSWINKCNKWIIGKLWVAYRCDCVSSIYYFSSLLNFKKNTYPSQSIRYWIVAFASIPFTSHLLHRSQYLLKFELMDYIFKKKKTFTHYIFLLLFSPNQFIIVLFLILYIFLYECSALDIFSFLLISVIRISVELDKWYFSSFSIKPFLFILFFVFSFVSILSSWRCLLTLSRCLI